MQLESMEVRDVMVPKSKMVMIEHENVRQMIRFSMLYSSIVRITPKYVFPAT